MGRAFQFCVLTLALVAAALCAGASAVVGGSAISIQAAPWTVSIRNAAHGEDQTWCTGVVVDALHVLTAGHCLYDLSSAGAPVALGDLSVVAGVSRVDLVPTGETPQLRDVISASAHPYFQLKQDLSILAAPDDIAVLTLASPLDLSGPNVKAVRLSPVNGAFPAHKNTMIAAYGAVTAPGGPDGVLNAMTATVLPQGQCGLPRLHRDYEERLQFNSVELCAQPTGAACGGDSGAGIVTVGANPTLLGILNEAPGEQSRCEEGIPIEFAYVGAGEISSWIVDGDPHPLRAPTSGYSAIGYDTLRPRELLKCYPPSATKRTVRYRFAIATGNAGLTRQSGPYSYYQVRRADVGKRILCETTVTNAGGTTISLPTVVGPVKP